MTGEAPRLEPDLHTWEEELRRQGQDPKQEGQEPTLTAGQPLGMRPWLAEEVLARRQALYPQIQGNFPHETEGYLKQRLRELQQESARRSQEFYRHLLAQGALQEIAQERQQGEGDERQQDDLQQLGLDLSMGMADLPQTLPGIEERLHEMGPSLRPEEYDQFLQRIERAKELHGLVSSARQAALRTISEALGQQTEAEETMGGRAGQAVQGLLEGVRAGEAPTLRSNIVRGLLRRQKELEARFVPLPEQLPESPFGRVDPGAMAASTRTEVERKQAHPPPAAGLEPDQVRQIIAQTMSQTLEEAMAGGLEEAGGAGDVRVHLGHLLGMLLPFGGGMKAGKGAAQALLPKLAAGTGKGSRLLMKTVESMGGMGLLAGFGAAMPLTPEQQLQIEQAGSDEEKAKLEEAYSWMNALHMGPMLLAYELGGGLGRQLGRMVPGRMQATRGALEGLGMASMFPAAGEAGMVGLEEVAKVLAPHSEQFSTMADLFAMQNPGPVKRFVEAIRSGEAEEAWEATKDYVKSLGVPAVAFSSLGVMKGLGRKFTSSAARNRALEAAEKEIDALEGLDEGQRKALKDRLREETADMAPEEVVERRQQMRREVEEKLGGPEEADRALGEQLLAERVPRPKGQEKRGEGLEGRRAEIIEARERAEVRAAEGDREAEREVRALGMEEQATESLRRSLRAKTPRERLQHEERAESFLEAAREVRSGREVESPTRSTPERRQAMVQKVLAMRTRDEIRAETEIETRGPEAIRRREAEKTPEPPPEEQVQAATEALISGDILTRAEEQTLSRPEVLSQLPSRGIRRLALRRGYETEGVSNRALRAALAPSEAQLRSMPLPELAAVARARGVEFTDRPGTIDALLGRKKTTEAPVPRAEPGRPGSKGPADRIELRPDATEKGRSAGQVAAQQLLHERHVKEHPEAGSAAPWEVMRGIGEGITRLHAIFNGDARYLRRAERMAGTERVGVKRDAGDLMRLLGTAPGLFGVLGREMTSVLAKIEKGLSLGRRIIQRITKTVKEDSEESKFLVRLLKSRHTRDKDPEAWEQATPEQVRIVEQLDRFFDTYRQTLAEHHPTSVYLARIRDEQRADAERFEKDRDRAQQMLDESWDRVDPDLRAEFFAVKKALKNAKGEKKEALRERLHDLAFQIDEAAPSSHKPAEWQDRLASFKRLATASRSTAERTEKQRQRFIEEWGQMKNYVPGVSAVSRKELQEILQRSMDKPNGLLPEELWDRLISVRAGHMKKKTGGLAAKEIEETDLIRILYHYIHRTIPAMEINSFVTRHWHDIYGRRRRASLNEVTQPWVTENGRFTLLEYWDPARSERIDVRSRGEFLKMEDGTYVRADRLGKKELSQARQQKRVLRMAGTRKRAAKGPERVVLLDRRVQRQPDGSFSRENSRFHPDDAEWMAQNQGSFIEIPSWKAGLHVYTRENGLAQILSKRQSSLLKERLGTLANVGAERMTGHAMFGRIEQTLRGLATGYGWLKIGALSPHSGANIFQGAYFLNTILWGPKHAARATGLATRYFKRLAERDMKANPFEQLAEAREVKLGEGLEGLFPTSEKLRTPQAELDKLPEKQRQHRIHLDDAMVDFHRSWISVGQKTMEFRDLGRTAETGEKLTGPSARKTKEGITNLGYAFIDAGEFVVRSSQYIHTHTLARRNGYTREQARRLSEDLVMATHGVFNRAFKSGAMQSALGMFVGTLTNWFQHAAGVFTRRIFGQEQGRISLPFTTSEQMAMRQRLTKNLTSGSGAAFLARYFVGAVAIAKIGELLGVDWSHTVGSVVDDIPIVGPTIDAWLRGVGRETSADPLGLERKPLVRGSVGEMRDQVAEAAAKLPYAGPTLAGAVKVLGGDFSGHEGGIPIPVMPFTVSGPVESLLRYGNQYVRASWYGDEEGRDRATRGLVRNLAGRQAVEVYKALTTEKTEEGDYARREGREIVEHYPTSGWENYALSILGPPISRQIEWMEKTLSLKRKKIDRALARSEGYETEKVMDQQMELEREFEEAGRRPTPEMRERAREIREAKRQTMEQTLARRFGIEGDAVERYFANRPRGGQRSMEAERFRQARSYFKGREERAREMAVATEKLDTRERDVLHAADANKGEGLRQFARILRDDRRPIKKERAEIIWKLMIGKRARSGDWNALVRWAAGAPQDAVEDFREAWQQAKERWRQ